MLVKQLSLPVRVVLHGISIIARFLSIWSPIAIGLAVISVLINGFWSIEIKGISIAPVTISIISFIITIKYFSFSSPYIETLPRK